MAENTPTLVKRAIHGNQVVVFTLNDPDRRNALSADMRVQFLKALRHEATNPESRAVVLTGAGSAFCAGGDISAMGIDADRSIERLKILHDLTRLLAGFPKPVVAAVNGHAFGAGWSLALLADYAITAPQAKFGATFGKMGLVPDTAFLWAAARRVGQTRSLQLFMSARTVAAEEALAGGLVDEMSESLLDDAIARAESFCGVAPLAFAAAKATYTEGPEGIEPYLKREFEDQSRMYRSKDHREAVAAFREKRSPQFNGS